MADKFTIPKFRERQVHWFVPETGEESSYPVSASYNGILRLSPNDDQTLLENPGITEYDEDIQSYYEDSIVNAIQEQFVRVSTPDGYFVNLRYTQKQFETDVAYVIGVAYHKNIRLFATQEDAIRIKNNTILPTRVNLADVASSYNDKDVPETDTHNPLDGIYILMSSKKDKRKFEYVEFRKLFKDIIINTLQNLASVPTGSIHYVPMSIHEYEKLLMQGNPNAYYKTDNNTPNEPLVRDYLVCDGSLYKNEDFPELAKILEGERIDYWRLDTKIDKMVLQTYRNDYTKAKHFRVPDLRARFIKAIKLKRQYFDDTWNEVGAASCDSRPWPLNSPIDRHVHFVTSAIYQNKVELEHWTQVANIEDEVTWSLSEHPGVIAPENKMQTRAWGAFGCDYNQDGYNNECRTLKVDSNTSGYFLSIPKNFDFQQPNCIPDVGLSSIDIPSGLWYPKSDEPISYNDNTDYVPYAQTPASGSYGNENTPEFFCALPLIKI